MIEFKISEPRLGEFIWKPGAQIQAKIMELPPNKQEMIKAEFAASIARYLHSISALLLTMGTHSAVVNAFDLETTMSEYTMRAFGRMEAEASQLTQKD